MINKYFKEFFLLPFLVIINISIYAQNPNHTPINFSDLKDKIGDKRIVLLGEENHWNGSEKSAINETIRYLHDSMGFNRLLLESDFFGTYRAYNDCLEGKEKVKYIWPGLFNAPWFTIYDYQIELSDIIESLVNHRDSFSIEGIDINQFGYSDAFYTEIPLFCKLLDKNFESSNAKREFDTLGLKYRRLSFYDPKKEQEWFKKLDFAELSRSSVSFTKYLDILCNKTVNIDTIWRLKRYKQAIYSLLGYYDQELHCGQRTLYKAYITEKYYKIRDSAMAQNAIWFIDSLYPNDKIIIATSSAHISRNMSLLIPKSKNFGSTYAMCDYLYKRYRDKIYSVAFISYEGENSIVRASNNELYSASRICLNKNKPGTIERKLSLQKQDYFFIDLKAVYSGRPFLMKFDLVEYRKTDWSKNYDALFFIKKSYPVKVFIMNERLNWKPYYKLSKEWYCRLP